MNPWTRRCATTLLGVSSINRAVRALAAARGHGLVLVYHRLGLPLSPECQIVPSVPVDVFRSQLQALGEVVDLVPLDALVERTNQPRTADRRGRPAVSITFDDDLPSHVEHALPALRECGVPGTFFLSGRALHGRGPYWFQQLEALLTAHGGRRLAALLELPEAHADHIALACERDLHVRRRVVALASDVASPPVLDSPAFGTLAASGATIGFHTLEHDTLPALDDDSLEEAPVRGRDRLAAATNTTLRYFAYPHGKADARAAAAVRRAGFAAAFTGRRQPIRRGDDAYRLGRWEPGPLGVDDLLVNLAVRLHAVDSTTPSPPWM